MKKIAIEVLALGVLLASAGCVRTDLPDLSDGEIVVRLNVDGMATKAEGDILSGHIYLFDNVDAEPYKTIDIDASGTTTLDFATVFGSDANKLKRTTVFAVTGESSAASPSSLADLKDNAITAPLFLDGNKVKSDPQFYMTAEGKFEKVNDSQTTCNLTLKRLAAKVALELDIPASITTNGNWEFKSGTTYPATTTWTPMTSGENARVYLQNAVSNTALGAASDPAVLPGSFTTFTYAPVFMNGATVSAPFYTYPVSWTRGDEKEPFIKLILPWRYTTTVKVKKNDVENDVVVDQNVVEFYYKIMFPAGITSFEANTYYLPKVKLNILGGEAARPTVIGADGLTVMNWKGVTSSEMPAVTINPSDFLVPERETFEVSNGNPLQIKYFASGEVNFTVKEIYKDVYTNNDTERRYIYSTSGHAYLSNTPIQDTDAVKDRYNKEFSGKDDKTGTDSPWFTNSAFDTDTKSGTLTLNHTLSDDFDLPNFAARPYHYEVELSLKDNSSVKKTITIIQNPSVLVDGEKSTGLVYVNNYTSGFGSSYKAKTSADPAPTNVDAEVYSDYYVNVGEAHKADATNHEKLGRVNTYIYLDPTGNNSCVWRIKVSVAPSDELFIMDPRDKTLSSVSVPSSPTAADLSAAAAGCNGLYGLINMHATRSGTSYNWNLVGSSLTNNSTEQSDIKSYYWPTVKTDASGLTNKQHRPEISPEFMMGSSYGKDGSLSYGGAVNRCLAYQEDGYPAGRWRVPTEAEIEYCLELQDCGAIPTLFTRTYVGYWASSGRVLAEEATGWTTKPTAYVRCVYDTWYWGDQEVAELKTDEFGNTSKKQYNWSGYQEKYMNKYYTPAP